MPLMPPPPKDCQALVIGAGPNGLAAAITLQQHGIQTLVIEGNQHIGGGLRSEALTLPGFQHDVCSAIHPLAAGSPFFKTLPLAKHGLEFIYPEIDAAHPLDDGSAALLTRSVEHTARFLGADAEKYQRFMRPLAADWPKIAPDVLGPLHWPKYPAAMARFGITAVTPVTLLAKRFHTIQAKALLAGMAAHSIQPLSNLTTSAIAMVLLATGHTGGWPVPQGGSVSIANALAGYYKSLGGQIQTGTYIKSLSQLPSAHAVLFDVTPRQLLQIAGHKFSSLYQWQLQRYRYGLGVFKIDWALDGPIPFTNAECCKAGTIHIGNTFNEIAASELDTWKGRHPLKPFVLLAQQSLFDSSRAPHGKHTAWAYCHVPNGSTQDMTQAIEQQIERFAPGFKDLILARHTYNTQQMEEHNPNYIGGDINGGVIDIRQLFTRPALRWSPYSTSAKELYLCSSSTPPGGGVHGMCGYYAAKRVLKEVFNQHLPPLLYQ